MLVVRPPKGGGAKDGPAPAASAVGGSKVRIIKSAIVNFPSIIDAIPGVGVAPKSRLFMRRCSKVGPYLAPNIYYVVKQENQNKTYISIYPCLYLDKVKAISSQLRGQINATLQSQFGPELESYKRGTKGSVSRENMIKRFWAEVESKKKMCIPLGKFKSTLSLNTNFMSLDYLYAFSLPPLGGTKMVCFFLEYAKKAFNLKLERLKIKLMEADYTSWNSYERMGFEEEEIERGRKFFDQI